ncbi:MAG: pyrroline-5-carboxylate reductase [Bacteroidales bacterium]|nr:pyrroline-5-carboxylate reductase [Bacteroidales bacterium]
MNISKVAIIGGGNLGTSIARGIRSLEKFSNESVLISEKRTLRKDYLVSEGFQVVNNNIDAVQNADLVIVSVKPQQFPGILQEINSALTDDKLLISTVTGFTHNSIEGIIGNKPNVRIMPNTAIEICAAMTCFSVSNTSAEQDKDVLNLFQMLGEAILVQEDQLDAVTVLGACGIAFALRFIRAATQGGIEIGFSAELSSLIAAKTVEGAAKLLIENSSHPEREIDKVTTPQGITISGLNEMEHQGFSSSVIKGILASFTKLSS